MPKASYAKGNTVRHSMCISLLLLMYCLCKLTSVCISYLFFNHLLQPSSPHLLFNALVINKLTHALPAYAGQLTADDKNRINAISRKAIWRGLTLTAFDIDVLIDQSDRKLYRQTTQPGYCLHNLFPSKTSTYSSHQLRKRKHPFLLPNVQYSQFKNLYISIVAYLNM